MKKLIQFELKKIFSKRLALVSLAVLLFLSLLLGISTYRNMYAFDGMAGEGTGGEAVEIDKAVAERYQGPLTDEKVRQMMADFAPKADLHGMNPAYLYQNATQSAAFARFSDLNGNWNGKSVRDVFGDGEIKIGYTNGWLKTSENMAKVFVCLSLVLAVVLAPVFSGEYGGVDSIILTSRYGRTKCVTAKVAAGIVSALLVTAAVSAFNLLLAFFLYGGGGLDCSILFAPMESVEGYIPFNITCGELLKYQILLAFTGAVSVAGVTLAMSALCKNPIAALAASAAAYVFPVLLPVEETSPLFRLVSLLPLYHAQFVSLMSVDQLGNGALYAVWAAPAALVLTALGGAVSRRAFAGHQIT